MFEIAPSSDGDLSEWIIMKNVGKEIKVREGVRKIGSEH